MTDIRKSILSGSWYPGDAGTLRGDIRTYEDRCPEVSLDLKRIYGIIAPHAGYMYSGKAAVSAYRHLRGMEFENIILIAPSHSSYFRGIACSGYSYYETPLGKVQVNRGLIEKLRTSEGLFTEDITAEDNEHSAEIQLPFLQYFLDNFKIVPLLAGNITTDEIPGIAAAIKGISGKKTLLLASSDFTHYGYRFGYNPFDNLRNPEGIRENINRLDMDHIELIKKMDYKGFLTKKHKTGATICGYMPISIVVSILSSQDIKAYLADYYTSGDITDDYEQSVSYASILFYK